MCSQIVIVESIIGCSGVYYIIDFFNRYDELILSVFNMNIYGVVFYYCFINLYWCKVIKYIVGISVVIQCQVVVVVWEGNISNGIIVVYLSLCDVFVWL